MTHETPITLKNKIATNHNKEFNSIHTFQNIQVSTTGDTLWQIHIIGKYITYNQTYGRNSYLFVPMSAISYQCVHMLWIMVSVRPSAKMMSLAQHPDYAQHLSVYAVSTYVIKCIF
jgi:hypothetical protein